LQTFSLVLHSLQGSVALQSLKDSGDRTMKTNGSFELVYSTILTG